jgi:hypothetical protein
VVNLKERCVIVHRNPQNGDYASVQTLSQGMIGLLALPDVEISISTLL